MGKVVNEKGCVEEGEIWVVASPHKIWPASNRNVAASVLTELQEYSSQCVVCRLKIYGGLSTSPTKPCTQAAFVDITPRVLAQETNGCKIQL